MMPNPRTSANANLHRHRSGALMRKPEFMLILRLLRAVWHVLPVVPFALGYYYLGLAALLMVALPYIKTAKLKVLLDDAEQRASQSAVWRKEADSLRLWHRRWRALTFLPAATA